MRRRRFLGVSLLSSLSGLISIKDATAKVQKVSYRTFKNIATSGNPQPSKTITQVVDVILPQDPEIENDFKASDFGAHHYLAKQLGVLGQPAMAFYLNRYSFQLYQKTFTNLNVEQQTAAVRAFVLDRDRLSAIGQDLLTALFALTTIGTFEGLQKDQQDHLYEFMGWYDPRRPKETYHHPNDGYQNL